MGTSAAVGLLKEEDLPVQSVVRRASTQAGIVTVLLITDIAGDVIVQIAQTHDMRDIVNLQPEPSPTKKSTIHLMRDTTRRKGAIDAKGEDQDHDHHVKIDTTVIERENTRKDTSIGVSVEALVRANLLLQRTQDSTAAELKMILKNTKRSIHQVKTEVNKLVLTVVANNGIELMNTVKEKKKRTVKVRWRRKRIVVVHLEDVIDLSLLIYFLKFRMFK